MGAISKAHNEDNPDVFNKPNSRFKNYKNVFENLLLTRNCDAGDPILNSMILYDASRIVTVSK
jgi:hypothetical protein